MSFDPVTMALCKGENIVGNVTLPLVQLTSKLKLGQTIQLTAEESDALTAAFNQIRTILVALETEDFGGLVLHINLAFGAASGVYVADGGLISVECKTGAPWEVTLRGYVLTPVE